MFAVVYGCNNPEPENKAAYYDSTSKDDMIPAVPAPEIYFDCSTFQPLKVYVTSTVHNAKSYKWIISDGTTYENERTITHKFSKAGTYTITLSAVGYDKKNYEESKSVTITAPTKCYVSGFTITAIPTNGAYYRCRFIDDYTVYATNFATTNWILLTSADLPYEISLTPQEIEHYTSKGYRMLLEKSTNGSASSCSVIKSATITNAQIWDLFSETLTYTGSNIVYAVHFKWTK